MGESHPINKVRAGHRKKLCRLAGRDFGGDSSQGCTELDVIGSTHPFSGQKFAITLQLQFKSVKEDVIHTWEGGMFVFGHLNLATFTFLKVGPPSGLYLTQEMTNLDLETLV